MTKIAADVTFPIMGTGETARISDRLPMRILSLSGVTIDATWVHGAQREIVSPYWHIYQNLDEGAEIRHVGGVFPLRAGAISVVPAWLPWRGLCRGLVRHGNALCDLPSVTRERVRKAFRGPVEIAAPGVPLALEGLELFCQLARHPMADETCEARGHAWMWSVVHEVFRLATNGDEPVLTRRGDFAFQQLLHRAEQQLDKPLGLRELSRLAQVGEAELVRRFKKYLATTPAKWVRERRIAFAAQLLRTTEDPIEEICERSGLGDRSHFTRIFSAWCGCGPAMFRKMNGESPRKLG